jgi:hypothetical protein
MHIELCLIFRNYYAYGPEFLYSAFYNRVPNASRGIYEAAILSFNAVVLQT